MNSRNPSFCVGAAMAIPAASSVNVIINECYQTSKRRPRTSHGKRHATGYGRLCKVIKQDTDLLLHEDIIVLHEIPAIFDCWGRLPSASSSFLCAISSLQEASDVTAFSHRCLPCSSSPSAVSTDSNDAVSFVIPEDFSEVERFLGESFCELDDMDDNYFSSDSVVPKLMQIDDDLTATESLVPEMEIGPEVNDASVTIDLSPSASLKNDYRIDLSEFEPAEGSFDDEQCSKEKSPCNSRLCLTLDYEDVMNEWSDRGSLWMDGIRPQIVPHDYDLDLEFSSYSQMVPTDVGSLVPDNQYGEVHGQPAEEGQNGREARVLRFKEKRRTRFFSKKIRYQVRKLNAERRPRIKGRFIKRLHMDSR